MSKEWNYDPRGTLRFKLRRAMKKARGKLTGDSVAAFGMSHWVLTNEHGEITTERWVENLITTVGFQGVADSVGKTTGRPATFTRIAIGTGATAAAIGNTTLGTEVARQDTDSSGTAYSYNSGTKSWTYDTTYAAGVGTGAITESGVLNAGAGGVLLNRQVFSVINKGANDSLTVQWEFTLS